MTKERREEVRACVADLATRPPMTVAELRALLDSVFQPLHPAILRDFAVRIASLAGTEESCSQTCSQDSEK